MWWISCWSRPESLEGLLDCQVQDRFVIGRMHTLPRQVRLVHGDDAAKHTLAGLLRQRWPGVEVVVP